MFNVSHVIWLMECLYLALSIQFVQLLKLTTLYYLYSRLQLCQAIEVVPQESRSCFTNRADGYGKTGEHWE